MASSPPYLRTRRSLLSGNSSNVTRFNCNGSSQRRHNDDSRTRQRHNMLTRTYLTLQTLPNDDLDETLGTALGTTSPINDHPHPPPCRRQRHVAPSMLLHRTRSPVALRATAYSPSSPGRSADRQSPAPRRY
jgi:hypothetical protein